MINILFQIIFSILLLPTFVVGTDKHFFSIFLFDYLPAAGADQEHKSSVAPLLSGSDSPFEIRSTNRNSNAPTCEQAWPSLKQ